MESTSSEDFTQKLAKIKTWLGSGSINIFGFPMSGKDTVGLRFAGDIGGKFLSSGLIIRDAEVKSGNPITSNGALAPTNVFYELVLPYFELEELIKYPLVLSSIGRWSGEENQVMSVAAGAGHPIKAAVLLDISETELASRWSAAKVLGDRGERPDDADPEVFRTRVEEFKTKTMPVIRHYDDLGLLVTVDASASRDQVYHNFIDALINFISA